MFRYIFCLIALTWCGCSYGPLHEWLSRGLADLPWLEGGHTKMANSLWHENPAEVKFGEGKRQVTIADLKGPAVIRMIHFALPATMKLGRELLLRIYWDDEKDPSVDCPLVDFFCDPNGEVRIINSLLVNKNRGWNAYFPMPFRQSARVVLLWDGDPLRPLPDLLSKAPCYAYVTYQTCSSMPENVGYFHAQWRQETLKLAKEDYLVVKANGRGRLVGWNLTVRSVHPNPNIAWPPVDMNVDMYLDDENSAALSYQGTEDAMGFSWGFPNEPSDFAYTGYHPFRAGYSAYRFFVQDAISFQRSLRMMVCFGPLERSNFQILLGMENPFQISTVAYWYQTEPHFKSFEVPTFAKRVPALDFQQFKEREHHIVEYRKQGVLLRIDCGHPDLELVYEEEGFQAGLVQGFSYSEWKGVVSHCWAHEKEVKIEIQCPPKSTGILKFFIADPDQFQGGRKQKLVCAGKEIGTYSDFKDGIWVEVPILESDSKTGKIYVSILNARTGSNAVLSRIEWLKK